MNNIENHKEFFNGMASEWDSRHGKVIPEDYRRLLNECGISAGQTVLDIGTGTGVLVPYILEKTGGKGKIYAVDYAEKMIERLEAKGFSENVVPLVMDIHNTDFENCFFDRAIANACFPHFSKKRKALKEIYRVLKKGGIFIISHLPGREFINNLHRNGPNIIERDIIPEVPEFRQLAETCGFSFMDAIDEENFFCISFEKKR